MRVGVLGTGIVGRTLATRLQEAGHEVRSGSRSTGDYADAAAFGEVVINATAGSGSLDALRAAGEEALRGKVLVDVANPLVFSSDGPAVDPAVTDSLAEQIQRAFPDTRVVKALNTVNADVMARPDLVPGDHVVFMCGDDEQAKETVGDLLADLGWPSDRVLDLGGVRAARGTEAYLLLWLQLMGVVGSAHFNITVSAA
jgi:predicted dinucleotide-binding enzyme